MCHTDKYCEYTAQLFGPLMFIYEVSECDIESSWCHWNFRYCSCFKQGVPWHLGNYRVYIYSETSMWHDNI